MSLPLRTRLFRKGSSSRNKLLFIMGGLMILCIAATFAKATERALYIRSATSSEFNQYVIDHEVGTAEESSDFSGFQGDFCVVHLRHSLPQNSLQNFVLKLLYQYHTLDGGTNLTLDYQPPRTTKAVVLADAVYDQSSRTVSLNLHERGSKGLVKVAVNWTNSWYNN